MDYPWCYLASCIQKICAFDIICIQQVGIIWHQMQQWVKWSLFARIHPAFVKPEGCIHCIGGYFFSLTGFSAMCRCSRWKLIGNVTERRRRWSGKTSDEKSEHACKSRVKTVPLCPALIWFDAPMFYHFVTMNIVFAELIMSSASKKTQFSWVLSMVKFCKGLKHDPV